MEKLRVYCQKWQTNGNNPVTLFERDEAGKWSVGTCKEDEEGKRYFNILPGPFQDMTQKWNDEYYWYIMRHNYNRFFREEKFDSNILFNSTITLGEINEMIFNESR